MSRAAFVLVVALVIATESCRTNDTGAGATEMLGADIVQLNDRSSDCPDCVRLSETVVLGDTVGDGYVVHTDYVVRDSLGNYWLGQYKDMIKVFDAKGRYLRRVGRAGGGPGEFSIPMPMYTDETGRVHVLDPSLARETIFRRDFEVDTVRPFPAGMMRAMPLRGGRYVANAPHLRTADGIGLPLHVTSGPDVVRSFGRSGIGIVSPFSLVRIIATDARRRIFSAWPFDYLVEVWADDGRRLSAFQGPTLSEIAPRPGAWSDDHPPVTRVIAMRPDGQGRLWVVIWRARKDWRANMREVPMAGGRTILQPNDGLLSNMYESRLDVLDLTRGIVLARWTGRPFFGAFADGETLVEFRALPDGTPQLALWRYELQDPVKMVVSP